MNFPIKTTDALFVDLLNNACKNPIFVEAGTEAFVDQGEKFSNYRVELHCMAITYTAIPLDLDPDGVPTKYFVISAVYEGC